MLGPFYAVFIGYWIATLIWTVETLWSYKGGPMMQVTMLPDEAAIICGAVEDADTWGCGRISEAKKRIEEAGYTWTPRHEQWIFETFDMEAR